MFEEKEVEMWSVWKEIKMKPTNRILDVDISCQYRTKGKRTQVRISVDEVRRKLFKDINLFTDKKYFIGEASCCKNDTCFLSDGIYISFFRCMNKILDKKCETVYSQMLSCLDEMKEIIKAKGIINDSLKKHME